MKDIPHLWKTERKGRPATAKSEVRPTSMGMQDPGALCVRVEEPGSGGGRQGQSRKVSDLTESCVCLCWALQSVDTVTQVEGIIVHLF